MTGPKNGPWALCASVRSKILPNFPHRMFSLSNYHRSGDNRSDSDHEYFYCYTSGRWLWAEEARLQGRYKKFSVTGLKRLAAAAIGAQSCVSMTKLAEGGFNKVFRLSMDNGAVVIARIPNPNVGPARRVIASEVATMDFVQNVLGIPVPKVLGWDGAILAQPDEYAGKTFCSSSFIYTILKITETTSKACGKPVRCKQVPKDVFCKLLPGTNRDTLLNMFCYFEYCGYYGYDSKQLVDWAATHARGKVSSFEQSLQREPLSVWNRK
ncbi:phosphotransferase enzyme family [Lecanosticta acicola]|uniref:Altered inheritance of mitochondria protein 9, mitochondrial n=1 Tax=Lecanosticta acicola TaxID=111012 RepID=A0AAI8YXI2_9PEZI|nr:phosphotransferase enzyme family [Lecanosticta acicola]